MTTVVVWQSNDDTFIDTPPPSIWVASDSRASSDHGTLTENCAKAFELHVRCEIRSDFTSQLTGPIKEQSFALAIAGNTLVGHNVVFSLQQGLSHLVGPALPSIHEVAEFGAKIATRITAEVGTIVATKSLVKLVVAGMNSGGEPTAVLIQPDGTAPINYEAKIIDAFPFAIGTGANVFTAEYAKRLEADVSPSHLAQLPVRVIDECFLTDTKDVKTGGTLHLISVSPRGTRIYTPFRWSRSAEKYIHEFFGENIGKPIVGDSYIGTSRWQLNDI